MYKPIILLLASAVICSVIQEIQSRTFKKAELYNELRRHGFPEYQLDDWACLVMAESEGNTAARNYNNPDGSIDHGLFQINDRYWCNNSNKPGKGCHVTCSELETDDITMAAHCAKKIYRRHGFRAWYGWVNKCQ